MEIYEIRGWNDGGPNDKGYLKGYINAESKEEAIKKAGIINGFRSVHEISKEEFRKRRTAAWNEYKLYKGILAI